MLLRRSPLVHGSRSAALLLATCALSLPAVASAENAILLLIDDLGTDGWRRTNADPADASRLPTTPTLDALADRGLVMRQAYASPTCSPTRGSIVTGTLPSRTGVTHRRGPNGPALPSSSLGLGELLALAPGGGPSTAWLGKWHLSSGDADPVALGGFDAFRGFLSGSLTDFCSWQKSEAYQRSDGTVAATSSTTRIAAGYATSDLFADALSWVEARTFGTTASSAEWLQASGSEGAGWLLVLAPAAVHSPYHVPPSTEGGPCLTTGTGLSQRERANLMLEDLDRRLGSFLATLDAWDVLDATNIIVIGDNGTPAMIGLHGTDRGKETLHETGVRVPLVMAGPAVVRRGVSDALIQAEDLWPTLVSLCGLDADLLRPDGHVLDGIDFGPWLRDPALANPRDLVFLEQDTGSTTDGLVDGNAVRQGGFKLVTSIESGVLRETFHELGTSSWVDDTTERVDLLASGSLTASQTEALGQLRTTRDTLLGTLEADTLAVGPLAGESVPEGFALAVTAPYPIQALELQRRTHPGAIWSPVPDAILTPGASPTTYQALDPNPPPTTAFYRAVITRASN